MLKGYLDELSSEGVFSGWAYDSDHVQRPLTVSVLAEGMGSVASGIAHNYREDLVVARCGIGWCGFELRTHESVNKLRRKALTLAAQPGGIVLHLVNNLRVVDKKAPALSTLQAVKENDPTEIVSIDQLFGCEDLFAEHVKLHGVTNFLRAAYAYVLSRPADADGLKHYGRLLRAGEVKPFAVMKALAGSDEFKSAPRTLASPTSPGFPFGLGNHGV